MEKYDVAIIGAGLGGLECAYILAKAGKKVIVLEKNKQYLGGCLQTFERKGHKFDTGFHYVGGLDEGQPLNTIFKHLGLMDLPWIKMDEDCFDEVIYQGKSYKIPQGFDCFRAQMKEYFPASADEIDKYADFMQGVADGIFNNLQAGPDGGVASNPLFNESAYDYLTKTISDPVLQNVLSGTSPKLTLNKEKLPLYIFAQINASFINSSYRLRGGGRTLIDQLEKNCIATGNVAILKGAEVTSILERDGELSQVEYMYNGNSCIVDVEDKKIIANVHPSVLQKLLDNESLQTKLLTRKRRSYFHTVDNFDNGFGMFTVNIKLKPGKVEYLNRNVYIHYSDDIWMEGDQNASDAPSCCLVSFGVPEDGGKYASNIDLLTPMKWEDVALFDVKPRTKEYKNFKEAKAKQLIEIAKKYIKGFDENAIEEIYTSSPLTYKDYIGSQNGSAFGINLEWSNQFSGTLISTATPIPGIYVTGQNYGLHGVLGVSVTAIMTCLKVLNTTVNGIMDASK